MDEFSTSDTDLAAYLLAARGELPALVADPSGRCTYIFSGSDIASLAAPFYAGDARVDPVRFSQSRKLLMSRVRERQQTSRQAIGGVR